MDVITAVGAGLVGAQDGTKSAGSVEGTARGSGPDYSSGLYDSYRYSYGANPPMKVRERETKPPAKTKRDKLLEAYKQASRAQSIHSGGVHHGTLPTGLLL